MRLCFPGFLLYSIVRSVQHGEQASIGLVLGAYALNSATGGLLSVYLSEYAQGVCGHDNELSCPFTAQVVWVAVLSGSITGTACTFAVQLIH